MATAEQKEAIRERVHQDSFQYGTKARFGLFSQPFSTGIGDTNAYPQKKPNLDEDGKVITGPIFKPSNPMKRGANDAQLFSKPSYNCLGEPFRMAGLQMGRMTKKNGHIDAGHDKAFVPAKISLGLKSLDSNFTGIRPPYPYMPLGAGVEKKNFKDEEGNIKTAPPNMKVMPTKVGKVGKNTTLSGPIPYIPDAYDAKRLQAKKELELHHSLIQEKPFSQMARAKPFNSLRQLYEENPPMPPKKVTEKKKPPAEGEEGYEPPLHDKAFKPSNPTKKGAIKGTISKFPDYLPNPPVELKRKAVVEGEDAPAPLHEKGFKATYRGLTRPQPSIATNSRNLKSQFPSAFAR